MITIFFSIVMAVHGLIHLLGFVKAFRLADIKELSLEISRRAGLGWLFAAVLVLLSVLFLVLGYPWWWVPGAVAVIVSQTMIVLFWNDSKFGTIANLVFLIAVVLGYGSWSFQRESEAELGALFAQAQFAQDSPDESLPSELPDIVETWLRYSNVDGSESPNTVHLSQAGSLRTSVDGKWMPFTAEQHFTTVEPGFVWIADVSMGAGLPLAGRDTYLGGKGHMVIKLLSLLPVADASGPEIDQGVLVRYLAEICWFPAAALRPYIEWEAIDSVTARATMRYGQLSASGLFSFSPEGQLRRFQAQRYYDGNGTPTLKEWIVETDPDGYGEFEGVRMPVRSSVTWNLESGAYTWFRLEITDLSYN